MRIFPISDIHLEFHKDNGKSFINSLPSENIDVIILAGDICYGDEIDKVIGWFCAKFKHVILINGNHDFYTLDREFVVNQNKKAMNKYKNYHWLDNSIIEIEGQRFLGTPLWFKKAPHAPIHQMNDIHQIKNFESWVYKENEKAINFLKKEILPGDIVITHYLPSEKCVSTWWKGSPLNAFFVCDVEQIIRDKTPGVWVSGHTHDSFSFKIGKTQMICNPFGYVGHHINTKYDENLIIEQTFNKQTNKTEFEITGGWTL